MSTSMRATSMRAALEIVTAILLGLVSVATAVGAYQASLWAEESSRYASVSQQLRDRNLTELLTSQLISRDDGGKLLDSIGLDQEMLIYPERTEQLLLEQRALIESATPELAAAWEAWVSSGYDLDLVPLSAPEYEAALFAPAQSMQYSSLVAYRLSIAVGAKSVQGTIAAVIFALALFLLGVAGVNSRWRVAASLIGSATLVFLGGLAVMLLAIF